MSTYSFSELDATWQERLTHFHNDYFYGGRSDLLWRKQAMDTLPALQRASDMLVCGEDLGMVPACVHPVMEELGIVCKLCFAMRDRGRTFWSKNLFYIL